MPAHKPGAHYPARRINLASGYVNDFHRNTINNVTVAIGLDSRAEDPLYGLADGKSERDHRSREDAFRS